MTLMMSSYAFLSVEIYVTSKMKKIGLKMSRFHLSPFENICADNMWMLIGWFISN